MDWDSGGKKGNIPGRGSEQQWLEDLANKLWKDPEDIGHNHQGWKIKKVVPHGEGTTAYLLTLTKQYHKSRIFINKNGKWFWKDPIDRHQGWQEVEGPSMEPSIEQEQSGAGGAPGGMTTTSAVSPVTGPNAFEKKKKWTEKFQGRKEKELSEMTTTGGGNGTSLGTTGYNVPGAFGDRLSHRKDHIEVLGYKMTPEGEKEYSKSADKLYEVIRKNVTTMLREGLPSKETSVCRFCSKPLPYMGASECPSCKKAQPEVPGIRPGERSYEKRFPSKPSKALESQGLGADFDAAQARYDAQTPEEDEILINCEKCGAEEAARITTKGSKGSSWWWEAVCTKCGQTFGNDNF
jgi:DNA-directed RNA polymerase subunit M/transcription elongation factor TFIIS